MNKDELRKRIDKLSPAQRKLLAGQIGTPNRQPNAYGRRIIAYVVGDPNISAGGLRTVLKNQLPDYMVPANFVLLDEMPRLPNGKIDLNALPASYESAKVPESNYVVPRTQVEQQLAQIWEEVLNFHPVGVHDNFFEIGGDSILSIQIIAKARKTGLSLGANQLFEHQTIAELALFVQPEKEESSPESPVSGPLPLTPIQHWFFEEHLAAPHHWNQAIMFHVTPPVNAEIVKHVVHQLISQHDALRLSFKLVDGRWEAALLDALKINSFQQVDLSSFSLTDQDRLIEENCARLHSSFRLSEGSLLQCVFFNCEPAQNNRLLFVAHHLVVDAVSWQILMEDFDTALMQAIRGENISLPSKTKPYNGWGTFLGSLAQAGKFREEFGFWHAQTQHPHALPVDFDTKLPVTEESIETLRWGLNERETQKLLKISGIAYRMRPEELLITAFLQAIGEWARLTTVTLGLERHGRESVGADIDLSRTVGWFTAYFPLTFHIPLQTDPGSVLKSVKEQLRQVPNGGIGYGILRYLDDRKEEAQNLKCRPSVIFNYLGKLNTRHSDLLKNVQMQSSGARDRKSERFAVLELNSFVQDGILQMQWEYSNKIFLRETIERLVSLFEVALRNLVNHCGEVESVGYTPADFPESGLNQEDLDELLNQLG